MTSLPTAPIAAITLVAGYLVADVTGVRAVGGVLLVGGLASCAVLWRRRVGVGRTAALVAVFLVLFVASHLLARSIGAWPAVLTVAAVMFVAAAVLADRRASVTAG